MRTPPALDDERMTDTWRVVMDEGVSRFTRDVGGAGHSGERRGPDRPQGDNRLPAHIMAAVRDTIRAAAATCVEPSRLEASGPYEWLAIVEAHDEELSQLVRRYIESCRYLDEVQHHAVDLGRTRLADAVRVTTFARDSMHRSVLGAIERKKRAD
jgi:hypothetical protein